MQKPAEVRQCDCACRHGCRRLRLYLAHTEAGIPIRGLARDAGCHASTVLRQIRIGKRGATIPWWMPPCAVWACR